MEKHNSATRKSNNPNNYTYKQHHAGDNGRILTYHVANCPIIQAQIVINT